MTPVEGRGGVGPSGRLVEALRAGRIQGEEARLRASSDALEGVFVRELFRAMRETVPESALTGGGLGEEMFTALLDEHLSEVAALRMGRGVGEALYRRFVAPKGGGSE